MYTKYLTEFTSVIQNGVQKIYKSSAVTQKMRHASKIIRYIQHIILIMYL